MNVCVNGIGEIVRWDIFEFNNVVFGLFSGELLVCLG